MCSEQPATRAPNLGRRFAELKREMLDAFERTAVEENYGLLYVLLGWEHLATCTASHYFVAVVGWQYPNIWPYFFLWLGQVLLLGATFRLVKGKKKTGESPLQPMTQRVGWIFLPLCANVAMLNVVAGQKIFLFLPVLGTLSSFLFLVLALLLSARFVAAALVMFVTGGLMARFPDYGFLLYGGGWLLVLECLGFIFLRKRMLRRSPAADTRHECDAPLPSPTPSSRLLTIP